MGVLGATSAVEASDPLWAVGCPNCLPAYSFITSSAPQICGGQPAILSAQVAPGLTYQWLRNGTSIPGATTAVYSASVVGTYRCLTTSSCGSFLSNTISVVIGTPPPATITAGGPTTFCSGSSVVLSANSGAGLYYQWLKNAANINFATQRTYTATATGNYFCKVYNGCYTTSNTINISVTALPAMPSAISGPASVCKHQNNVVYSIAPVAGTTSYTWTVPTGTIFNSGQGSNSINVKFGTHSGNVQVKANNNCGSGPLRSLAVAMPCRESDPSLDNNFDELVYPNPSADHFTLRISSGSFSKSLLVVKDMTGKEVERIENISSGEDIEFGNDLAKGIYIASITVGTESRIMRLMKVE
jgi:hypothetical protein